MGRPSAHVKFTPLSPSKDVTECDDTTTSLNDTNRTVYLSSITSGSGITVAGAPLLIVQLCDVELIVQT